MAADRATVMLTVALVALSAPTYCRVCPLTTLNTFLFLLDSVLFIYHVCNVSQTKPETDAHSATQGIQRTNGFL